MQKHSIERISFASMLCFYYVGNIVFDISGISTKVSHDNTWRSHFCSRFFRRTHSCQQVEPELHTEHSRGQSRTVRFCGCTVFHLSWDGVLMRADSNTAVRRWRILRRVAWNRGISAVSGSRWENVRAFDVSKWAGWISTDRLWDKTDFFNIGINREL